MSPLVVSTQSPVARLTLSRAAEGNALDLALARELLDGVRACAASDATVLVLAAEGALFCGGGDVKAMASASDPVGYTRELADTLHEALLALARSPLVTIAAVQGPAAGAGLSLVANADIAVAVETATFTSAYAALGVSPDGGGSFLLPRVVGMRRAAELLLGGRRIDAATAREWGLVSTVVDAEGLDAAVDALAARVASFPKPALSATKRLLSRGWLADYEDHLAAESESIAHLIGSPESRLRQDAFLSRR